MLANFLCPIGKIVVTLDNMFLTTNTEVLLPDRHAYFEQHGFKRSEMVAIDVRILDQKAGHVRYGNRVALRVIDVTVKEIETFTNKYSVFSSTPKSLHIHPSILPEILGTISISAFFPTLPGCTLNFAFS